MRKISAEIIADSVDNKGNRITSYILTYPRFIHAEVMTHRMFSRNAASSRAIPFKKMVKSVMEDPFIPIAWQKDHKGMQGSEYCDNKGGWLDSSWLVARDSAVYEAKDLHSKGVTKQLCNRILEPYLWYTNLVTATEYDNFFELRCPSYGGFSKKGKETSFKSKKDVYKHFKSFGGDTTILDNQDYIGWQSINTSHAEIHIQALAEAMWDAKNESKPKTLEAGKWHIPFGDKFDMDEITKIIDQSQKSLEETPIKIATARCARLSYETHDGEINYEKDIKLHDQLLERKHASCFEHCAKAMSEEEYYNWVQGSLPNMDSGFGWCRNFKGFIPYRQIVKL